MQPAVGSVPSENAALSEHTVFPLTRTMYTQQSVKESKRKEDDKNKWKVIYDQELSHLLKVNSACKHPTPNDVITTSFRKDANIVLNGLHRSPGVAVSQNSARESRLRVNQAGLQNGKLEPLQRSLTDYDAVHNSWPGAVSSESQSQSHAGLSDGVIEPARDRTLRKFPRGSKLRSRSSPRGQTEKLVETVHLGKDWPNIVTIDHLPGSDYTGCDTYKSPSAFEGHKVAEVGPDKKVVDAAFETTSDSKGLTPLIVPQHVDSNTARTPPMLSVHNVTDSDLDFIGSYDSDSVFKRKGLKKSSRKTQNGLWEMPHVTWDGRDIGCVRPGPLAPAINRTITASSGFSGFAVSKTDHGHDPLSAGNLCNGADPQVSCGLGYSNRNVNVTLGRLKYTSTSSSEADLPPNKELMEALANVHLQPNATSRGIKLQPIDSNAWCMHGSATISKLNSSRKDSVGVETRDEIKSLEDQKKGKPSAVESLELPQQEPKMSASHRGRGSLESAKAGRMRKYLRDCKQQVKDEKQVEKQRMRNMVNTVALLFQNYALGILVYLVRRFQHQLYFRVS